MEYAGGSIADFFGANSVASALGIRPGATPCGQSRNEPLHVRAVVAIGGRDPASLASLGNRQLGGAFGTLRESHDLFAQLVVARFAAKIGERLSHIGPLDLAPRRSECWQRTGGREPQRLRIEFEQSWRLWSGIAELEAELDGVELGRGSGQQRGR